MTIMKRDKSTKTAILNSIQEAEHKYEKELITDLTNVKKEVDITIPMDEDIQDWKIELRSETKKQKVLPAKRVD